MTPGKMLNNCTDELHPEYCECGKEEFYRKVNEPVYDIWEDCRLVLPIPDLTPMEMVREFHDKFGVVRDPLIVSNDIKDLREGLIAEELHELTLAMDANDRVEIADALGDLLYVIYGAAEVWGIDIDRVLCEIHRSNMTKSRDGIEPKIHKIKKGPNYSPPDLSFVLETP